MTAGSLLTILFYAWLIISAITAVIWYRRRTKRRAETQQNRLRLLNERDAKHRSTADDNDAGQTASVASETNTSDTDTSDTDTSDTDISDTEIPQAVAGTAWADTSEATSESRMVTAGVAAGATAVAASEMTEPGSSIDLNEFIFDGADNPNGHGSPTEESNLDFTDGIDTDELNLKEDDTDEIDLPPGNGDPDEPIDHSPVDESEKASTEDTDSSGPADDNDESDNIEGDDHGFDASADTTEQDTDVSESDDTPADSTIHGDDVDNDSDTDTESDSDGDIASETVSEGIGTDRLLLGSLPGDSEQASPNLSDLLGELDMPYGLEPLPGSIDDEQEHGGHVALVSEHGDAAEVGTALADALVDRGYEFEAIGHDRGLARRSSDLIALRIIPEIGTSDVHNHYSQLGLADSAMVIEMWSGQAALDATSSNAG